MESIFLIQIREEICKDGEERGERKLSPVHSHLRATFRTVSGKREGKLSERTDFSEDWLVPSGSGEAARILLGQDEKARFFAYFPPEEKEDGEAKKSPKERMDVSSASSSSSFRSLSVPPPSGPFS